MIISNLSKLKLTTKTLNWSKPNNEDHTLPMKILNIQMYYKLATK